MRLSLPMLMVGLLLRSALVGAEPTAGLIRIRGAIGPATAGYIARAIAETHQAHRQCLIIQLDTPGGLLDSTKQIVQSFYESSVPVVVYVAPPPAGAISAGCFVTLAADVAAMAPNTTIGAAHPVIMGGGGAAPGQTNDVMTQKLESFASSYIEAIAAKRNRNVEWAISAVRQSASITAEQALELNVIEIIADDLPDLLRQLDGRQLGPHTLQTVASEVVEIPMLTREKVFQLLWRPEVMFILMLIAVYGILGELSNPGAILPGVTGVIALILALYMTAILPVNIAGALLLLLAIALFLAEVFTPTFGLLTAGGVVSFFLGSLLLFDRVNPAFRLPLGLIITATVFTAAFFILVIGAGLRAQLLPSRTGRESMIGQQTTALDPINEVQGRVVVEGEYWNARSRVPVAQGQPVEIIAVKGLTLHVKPK